MKYLLLGVGSEGLLLRCVEPGHVTSELLVQQLEQIQQIQNVLILKEQAHQRQAQGAAQDKGISWQAHIVGSVCLRKDALIRAV